MIASERFSKIVAMVNEREFISTKELSKTLDVTETTIRRDCEELEKQGLLIRVHGGAKSIKTNPILSNIDDKEMSERSIYSEQKEAVCKKAASFVKDGDCIFLDGGTSVVPILKYLKGKKVQIVTHSLLIARYFDNPGSELFMLGGKYIPKYNLSIGPMTLSEISRFNFDYAFLGCTGIDLDRRLVYMSEMDTIAIKQKAMEQSVKKYLFIDTSKINIRGFCSFISSDDFDAVICKEDEKLQVEELPNNYILVE